MRIITSYITLLGLLFGLTACPYKEVYRPISEKELSMGSVTARPLTLFFNTRKDTSTCHVSFNINNSTDSVVYLVFKESYLANFATKLSIEKVYGLGKAFPPNHTFQLLPQKDTALALEFSDAKKNFQDTIKVNLVISGLGKQTLIYKRVR